MAAGLPAWFVGQRRIGTPAAEATEPVVSRAVDRGTSLLRSSPAFVILAIVAMSTVNFAGPDLWRYLLGGRIFLTTGTSALCATHFPTRRTDCPGFSTNGWRRRS